MNEIKKLPARLTLSSDGRRFGAPGAAVVVVVALLLISMLLACGETKWANPHDPPPREGVWEPFGRIQLDSGKLLIEDAGFTPSLVDGTLVELPVGTYEVQRKLVVYGDDARNMGLRVILPDQAGSRGDRIGETWTDTGETAASDYERARSALRALGERVFYDRYAKVLEQESRRAPARSSGLVDYEDKPLLLFVSSGFGDGQFPIYELVAQDQRVGIEVQFIAPGTPYPFTPEIFRGPERRALDHP